MWQFADLRFVELMFCDLRTHSLRTLNLHARKNIILLRAKNSDSTPKFGKGNVQHVTGNDKDYLRLIPRVVW
jgi:hypothetical protein